MSRYFLLVSDEQDAINDFLAALPADAKFVRDWHSEHSDIPMLLFTSEAPVVAPALTPATVEATNPGWHVGQRVKAVAGKSHLIGLEGEVRAYFPSEESDDDDQVARNGIEAKMDGRPFPQLVVKFDAHRRRIRYSGAADLLKLQVVR